MRTVYPFSAIVGQDEMKLALLLTAVEPALGGVMVFGDRGTGKSTAVRALPALLPALPAHGGCAFGCDPAVGQGEWCEGCRRRHAEGEALPTIDRPVPVVDLPLGATEDRIVGARATRLPLPPEDAPAPPEPPPPSSGPEDAAEPPGAEEERELAERVVAAAAAAIPPDLLALLAAGAAGGRGGGRQGEAATEGPRGRRIGTRRGDPRRGARLDLLATIRAAVPWQRLRGGMPGDGQLAVRPDDFRIQRRWRPAATTTILVVDASGSTALHRLNEAKGAAEQLLAASYVRRDAVAMIIFRGTAADLVLPPTRALARAKRALVGLPGGGGTPLAAALDCIGEVQRQVRRGGGRAVVLILSDGRANVTRAGTGGRPVAHAEALGAAQRLRTERVEGAWLDIGPRPSPVAREVAEAMGVRYLPLPIADAAAITRVATGARDAA